MVLSLLVILFLLLPTEAAAQDCGDPMLTLRQAIEMALTRNRTVENQALATDSSVAHLKEQRTYYLPQFDVEALGSHYLTELQFDLQKGMMGSVPDPGGSGGTVPVPPADMTVAPMDGDFYYTVTVQVKQPLSQIYQISLETKQAALGVESSRSQLRQQQQTVINQVKTTYYSLLQTRAALDAQEEQIAFYRELQALVEREVRQKTALRSDLLNTRAELANAEYGQLKLINQLDSQKEQLNNLLGREIGTPFSVDMASARPPAVSLRDDADRTALAQRPEIEQAELSLLQAKQSIRISRAAYIPQLSVALNVLNTFNYPFIPTQMVAVGLLFEWDVFDWGRKRQSVLADKIALRQAQNKWKDTRASVLMDVNNALRSLREAQAHTHATEVSAEAASESLRITMNKYRQKSALLTDVLQAQANLSSARDQSRQAVLDVWTAQANLEKALGMGVTRHGK